ncbi:MAG: class I SAM-dependent methyltransferase [Dehalococcoidia bacterium]|nr:class I SAM-dependent methyltransferase [Dehalococcoidia bacterium]
MTDDPDAAGREYLRRYLRIAPAALALWRAIEAKHIATAELPRPILDLGSGFGEFASVFFNDPPDVGVDIRRPDMVRAQEGQCYKSLALADGRQLPFRTESFGSVMSVSVLEHIPRTHEAVAEAYRVLKSGGRFVFTAPTRDLSESLFYSRLLKRVGLSPLGRLYAWLLNRALYHVSLLSEQDWLRLLEQVGFRVEEHRMTINRRSLRAFDLTLPFALPSQISRLLLGHRRILRPEWLVKFWQRRLEKYVVGDDGEGGCNLFVVARKP